MNRNVESRFSQQPAVKIGRSKFDMSFDSKTSFNAGDLIPLCKPIEVLPGDTFSLKSSKVIRMTTLQTPIMDNIYFDTYAFFVPNRLVWEHWKEFCGENTESAWIPQTEYQVPQITAPTGGWTTGSIADYFGIPIGVDGFSVNALPFRALALVCNEWFRDQNVTDPLVIPKNDTTVAGSNGTNYLTDVAKGGMPFKAAKFHDYFTSALPGPQKGPDVPIPLGTFDIQTNGGNVVGNGYALGLTGTSDPEAYYPVGALGANGGSGSFTGLGASAELYGKKVNTTAASNAITSGNNRGIGVPTKAQLGDHPEYSGLVVDDVSSTLSYTAGTINALRLAFQTQKFYEKLAVGGSRYTEILRSMFGVISPDARLQRPEYLGGNRFPININQVVQSSASQAQSGLTTTPQGTTTAYSLTADTHWDFERSFTEHGFILILGCCRYDHSYQQGLDRLWSRKDRFQYFWPVFSNVGEVPILNKELYLQSDTVKDEDGNVVNDKAFGYQEAWADYRFSQNSVTSQMRSAANTSLDTWHLADDYASLPTLSDSWIREDATNIDRVLVYSSAVSHQFFADFFFDFRAVRPMPLFSIPGLIDHH